MKRILLNTTLLFICTSSFCQTTSGEQSFSQQDYLQKSSRQKKTAHVLLGVGGGLMLTAFVLPRGKKIQDGICIFGWCSGDEYENDQLKGVVGTTGAVTALSSLLFFRAAKKNARRAATAGLHMESAPQLLNGSIVRHSFPALQIRWSF